MTVSTPYLKSLKVLSPSLDNRIPTSSKRLFKLEISSVFWDNSVILLDNS
jgi:hypothetical protein